MLGIIQTEEEFNKALERINEIFHAPKNSPEGDEAELLMLLIEKYEEDNYPIESPDPVEAIKFWVEQLGLNQKDLAEVIGYKSRVSEILNRKRKLSLNMICSLHRKLNIPYESLMAEY